MIQFPKKVILIDLDNTLTDTEGNSRSAMLSMYNELGLSSQFPPFESFWEIYHKCNDDLWDRYRKGTITRERLNELRFSWPMSLMGVSDEDLSAKICEVFYKYFLPLTGVVPGAYELLEYLSKKYRLAILSNGTKSSQIVKMKNFRFEPYFEKVFLSDDIGFPKPDVRIYQYALNVLNVSPEEALMIGDDFDGDIVGAANAGIEQVWLNQTNIANTSEVNPSLTIQTLSELIGVL